MKFPLPWCQSRWHWARAPGYIPSPLRGFTFAPRPPGNSVMNFFFWGEACVFAYPTRLFKCATLFCAESSRHTECAVAADGTRSVPATFGGFGDFGGGPTPYKF